MRRAVISLVTALSVSGAALTADRRPMTVDDALQMVRVGDVAISPDGDMVFYSESRLDWDTNKREKTWYLVPAAGGEAKRFVGEGGGSSFHFTPDGASLSFLRDVHGDAQVHLLPQGGGEAYAVTSHAGGVESFRWSRSAGRLFFVAEEQRGEAERQEWDAGGDAVFVGEGPNSMDAGAWSNLWFLDTATGEETRLTEESLAIESFDVAPDGQRVVFTGLSDLRSNYFYRSDLYLVDARDRRVIRLTENDSPEERPTWSPDGRSIAYHSPNANWADLRHGYLWIMDPDTRAARRLAGQSRGELGTFVWSRDGESLLFSESRGVDVGLYRLDVATDEVTALIERPGRLQVRGFSQNRRRLVYTHEDFHTPPDLFVSDVRGRDPVRLTDSNPWIADDLLLGEGQIVEWNSTDGMPMQGTLVLPPGRDESTRLPLIMNIHGGPPGFFGNEFDTDFHVWTGLGYAAFGPNPRGSSSFGDEHLRALMGDVGGGEFDDLVSGVDALIARGIADPQRLALRGWSWGGTLGAWTITHTDRFAAASLGAMVGDWFAETGGGLMYDLRLHYIQCEPYADPDEWRRRSAATYLGNVVTPTILLHGEKDDVSTVNQSLMFYTALRDKGVPVRFIKFPRQGHDIREPRHQRTRDIEEIRFVQKHARDIDWDPGPFVAREKAGRDASRARESKPDLGWLEGRTPDDVDRFFIEQMQAATAAGMSAAVVSGGRVSWARAYGWADVATRRPVTTDTLFQLASVSKTITSYVVMQEVERGALDLDANVNAVLPFEVKHPAHASTPITLRQLLTHTAAIRDNWDVLEGTWVRNGDFPKGLGDSLQRYLTPGGVWFEAAESYFEWAPGTKHRYSNVGIALAAYLAEVSAGRPFEELCAEQVFQPLGMSNSSFRLRDLELDDLAMPYERKGTRFEAQGHHGYLDFPAGTMRTSAPQLGRFLLSFIGNGEFEGTRLLRADTVEEMRRVQFPMLSDTQGLVWYASEMAGKRVLGHDGGDPGVSALMAYRPDDGVGIVLLVNGDVPAAIERTIVERLFELGTTSS